MNKQTYPIPDGCKAITMEIIDNAIVTTFEPQFKRGDVLYAGNEQRNYLVIFKKFNESDLDQLDYYVMLNSGQKLIFNNDCDPDGFRLATTEEAQPLWDALAKVGKRWNPETMEVEEIKKEIPRANIGGIYYCVNSVLSVTPNRETHRHFVDIRYNCGNYFLSEEQAQRAAEKLKQALDEFWKEELK